MNSSKMNITAILLLCSIGLLCITNNAQSAPENPGVTSERRNYSYRTETKGHLELEQDMEQCEDLLGPELVAEIDSYQDTANQIIHAATEGDYKGRTYNELAKFVDRFGQRLSGSQSLEDSIDYMIQKMMDDGYSKAWGEEVVVPHWIRGEETAQMLTPRKKKLAILGLGTSVGTPVDGLTAEVLVVRSFEELTLNAEKAIGKIVVYNQPWESYEESVAYRSNGANAAAKVGAIAALVRSVAPFSLDSPHTGTQDYELNTPHIPVACIAIEDAELLDRLFSSNETITIHLKMLDYNLPLTTSRNAIGELTGDSIPEELVIVSGHIDSWDVGQGAMDDGGGCLISTEAVALIKHLDLKPKRSIQAVMWTAEEIGLYYWGSQDYVRYHKADLGKIIAAFESDGGTFTPRGLDFSGLSDRAGCIIHRILQLTESTLNATTYARYQYVSTDISNLIAEGVPGLSLNNEDDKYFWYHHTESDTMSMMNSEDLDKGMALWAVASYVIADLSIPLPRTVDV